MIWLDNHLSPALAQWIELTFGEACRQIRDLGLARAARLRQAISLVDMGEHLVEIGGEP